LDVSEPLLEEYMKQTETPRHVPAQDDTQRARPRRGMRVRTQLRAGGGQDDGYATWFPP
jgi:hypothetical protein